MRHQRWNLDERLHRAQTLGQREQLAALAELDRLLAGAFQVEREHSRKACALFEAYSENSG